MIRDERTTPSGGMGVPPMRLHGRDAHATAQCPVCAAAESRAVGVWPPYRLVACRQCGLVYSLPRPTPEDLAATYAQTYYVRPSGQATGYDDYRGEPELNARNMWELIAPFLAARFPTPGALLDVGCATGAFAARAREAGWSVAGVEFSPEARAIAREEFGLDVRPGGLRKGGFPDAAFDVVTLWHVLEHLVEPMADLAEARRVLRPGGLLWIELPNWDSIGRRLRGMRWAQIKPPEHINYFTPGTLRAAVERAGLEVLDARTHYHPAMAEAFFAARRLPLRPLARALARAADLLGWGGYVRLWARKAEGIKDEG